MFVLAARPTGLDRFALLLLAGQACQPQLVMHPEGNEVSGSEVSLGFGDSGPVSLSARMLSVSISDSYSSCPTITAAGRPCFGDWGSAAARLRQLRSGREPR